MKCRYRIGARCRCHIIQLKASPTDFVRTTCRAQRRDAIYRTGDVCIASTVRSHVVPQLRNSCSTVVRLCTLSASPQRKQSVRTLRIPCQSCRVSACSHWPICRLTNRTNKNFARRYVDRQSAFKCCNIFYEPVHIGRLSADVILCETTK